MLFEFHSKQNTKRPGSVHATYLITGTKQPPTGSYTNGTNTQDDDDTVMQSSPPLPASSAPVQEEDDEDEELPPVRSVMLVKEEHLAKAKATFDSITGIHVYSLQVNGLSDIQTLTECNRKIAVDYSSEDPQLDWKQYGTIQNPNAKRRTTRVAPPTTTKAVEKKATPVVAAKQPSTLGNAAPKPQMSSRTNSNQSTVSKPEATTKPTAPKRDASALFKSFAKSKPKSKQEESQGSMGTSQDTKDEPMGGFSDDDADDGAAEEEAEEVNAPTGKSKKEREADLEAMMDKEDEPMDDAPEPAAEEPQEDNAIDKPDSKSLPEPKETVTVENGRRRGRRRVMKKKTVKDEDGYLGKFNMRYHGATHTDRLVVTKEEAAWESFSEEEPAPKKLKPSVSTTKSTGGNKKAAKPGQGNIMSFFGKK